MTPGTRIRFNSKCPWPERVGCEGVVVAPRADGVYPQPAAWEALVLLDDDPLARFRPGRWWTCATSQVSLDLIPEEAHG